MRTGKKVLVVDDHPLMAQATGQLLEQIEGVEVIGIVGTGQDCITFLERQQPDIIFLDYQLPDLLATSVAEQIRSRYPQVHIVIFTGIDITNLINRFIELGVSGIVSKESSENAIKNMIRCIMDNHTVIPLSLFHQMRFTPQNQVLEIELTKDEVTIMTMIVRGATHEQIADEIHISKRSVDNYLKKIYEKFGVISKVQAIERFVHSPYYSDSERGE